MPYGKKIKKCKVSFNVFGEVERVCNGLFIPKEADPHPSSDECPSDKWSELP